MGGGLKYLPIMGGNYRKHVLFLVEEICCGGICQMEMHRLHNHLVPLGTDRHHPTIGVACNNVTDVVGRYKRDHVAAMASFLEEWPDQGFVILQVVDGARNRAKQATLGHISKREIIHVRAIE